jgi:glycosyltransferase involved in cell wall biosynthesis
MSDVLPISVIVTLLPSRDEFFVEHCLPSIVANNPAEIIVERAPGGMCERRNRGAAKATQPFLLFCDDDDVLYPETLRKLLDALTGDGDAALAYGHYRVVPHGDHWHPAVDVVKAAPWNVPALRSRNYVNSCSLLRASTFPGWDEKLLSYVDWDMALTLAGRGHHGVFIDEILFEAHYIDKCNSAHPYGPASRRYILQKHGL